MCGHHNSLRSGPVLASSFSGIAMLFGEDLQCVAPPCSSHGEEVLVVLPQVAVHVFTVHG